MIDENLLIKKLDKIKNKLIDSNKLIANNKGYFLEKIIEIVKNEPKVGEWIPVEERLPDAYKTVLITTYNQEVRTAFLDGEHYWISDLWTYTFDDVLAWQPRPEHYEVKENE